MEFARRESVEQVEEGEQLVPKFDEKGLIPCVTMHVDTREVLMFAFMNEDSGGATPIFYRLRVVAE